jgi:hypothetical protein
MCFQETLVSLVLYLVYWAICMLGVIFDVSMFKHFYETYLSVFVYIISCLFHN